LGKSYEEGNKQTSFFEYRLNGGLTKILNDIYTTGDTFANEIPVEVKRENRIRLISIWYISLRDLDKIYGNHINGN
jgi:hypothetical protein